MKINITKEQYKEMISMLAIANGIVGILGDVLPETDYKKRSNKMEKLESYFLQYAADFGHEGLAQKFDKNDILDDEFYENAILPIIEDYEEFAVHDNLSTDLAWRDFRKEHSEKEMEEMAKENGDYFGVALYDYEKKYWDEFDEHGYDRLVINK